MLRGGNLLIGITGEGFVTGLGAAGDLLLELDFDNGGCPETDGAAGDLLLDLLLELDFDNGGCPETDGAAGDLLLDLLLELDFDLLFDSD